MLCQKADYVIYNLLADGLDYSICKWHIARKTMFLGRCPTTSSTEHKKEKREMTMVEKRQTMSLD
jgi:hypothetical protein